MKYIDAWEELLDTLDNRRQDLRRLLDTLLELADNGNKEATPLAYIVEGKLEIANEVIDLLEELEWKHE